MKQTDQPEYGLNFYLSLLLFDTVSTIMYEIKVDIADVSSFFSMDEKIN
jgi:hypothetical protein